MKVSNMSVQDALEPSFIRTTGYKLKKDQAIGLGFARFCTWFSKADHAKAYIALCRSPGEDRYIKARAYAETHALKSMLELAEAEQTFPVSLSLRGGAGLRPSARKVIKPILKHFGLNYHLDNTG